MKKRIQTLLLLALPASGKSEVRKYLTYLMKQGRSEELHLGAIAELDDYPWVEAMRHVDEIFLATRKTKLFYDGPDKPFHDPREWLTLIELLNEDYTDIVTQTRQHAQPFYITLLERIERAATRTGLPPRLRIPKNSDQWVTLFNRMEPMARAFFEKKKWNIPGSLDKRTLIIEFARGIGKSDNALTAWPRGYHASIAQLCPAILENASILYIWVTPEESRRKNKERSTPPPGFEGDTTIFHGVPEIVMENDYSGDDLDMLEAKSDYPHTVEIKAHGRIYHLPIARFDNRVDKTTMLRGKPEDWPTDAVAAVHEELKRAMDMLINTPKR